VTATRDGRDSAIAAGYTQIRVECRVFATQVEGTVALHTFWSDSRQDNVNTATQAGDLDAINAGYRLVRTEGYVYPPTI
jgi:hypothetical protein